MAFPSKQKARAWRVVLKSRKNLEKAYQCFEKKKDGRTLSDVQMMSDAIVLTWDKGEVNYKTAADLTNRACPYAFKLLPAADAAPETCAEQPASSGPGVSAVASVLPERPEPCLEPLPAGSATAEAMSSVPSESTVTLSASHGSALCQGGNAVSNPTQLFEAALEKYSPTLRELFGKAAGHEILARALAITERYSAQSIPLPNLAPCSLLSVAIALTGLPKVDMKRKDFLRHLTQAGRISVKATRQAEAIWMMSLPFEKNSGV